VRRRLVALGLVLGVAAMLFAWRSQLFTVERGDASPRPLALIAAAERRAATFDASLPMVPVGVERLVPGEGVLLVHYWAPWERHSGAQALALDTLRRELGGSGLKLAVVCFDPYPSVSRYLGRMRLRLPVMLDLKRALADRLPCPSIPYTYLVDREGRIAAAQAGEIDWLAPATKAAIERLLAEPAQARVATSSRRGIRARIAA
jgi:hypothetical protein